MTAPTNDILQRSKIIFKEGAPYPLAYLSSDQERPLQSTRNPQREAQNLAEHWIADTSKVKSICLLGITSMYIVEELIKILKPHSNIFILEPRADFLNAFLEANDTNFLEAYETNVSFITGDDEEDILRGFRAQLRSKTILCGELYISPVSTRLRPELNDLARKIHMQVRLEAMDRVTTTLFADEWIQNCIINLPDVLSAPSVDQLFNKFTKTDTFILCAGPTLTESLETIKELQDEALIICVGTALKPALKAGIRPDITIVVDSAPHIFKQFHDIKNPPGWFLGKYTVFPGLYQLFKEKSISFNSVVTQDFAEWLSNGGFQFSTLNIGGTVALTAIDCAIKLGSRNTFIYGLDLSYSNDGTSHAADSVYDGNKVNKGLVKVQGNWQKEAYTTQQFANYVQIFNRYLKDVFAQYSGKIFNVNSAGAKIDLLTLVKPDQIKTHFQKTQDNIEQNLKLKSNPLNHELMKEHLEKSVQELQDIKTDADFLLQKFDGENIPLEIEEFEQKIKNSSTANCFLSSAMQQWCMSLNSNLDKTPYQMSQEFLERTSGAIDWLNGLLNNSLNRFLKKNTRS